MDALTVNFLVGVALGVGLPAIFARRRSGGAERLVVSVLAVGALIVAAALSTEDWRRTASVGVFALLMAQLAVTARGRAAGAVPPGRSDLPPPTYLPWSVVATLLFWPLGVAAIVNAARVNRKWAWGDRLGAMEASVKARTLAAWATGVGLAWLWLSFVLVIR